MDATRAEARCLMVETLVPLPSGGYLGGVNPGRADLASSSTPVGVQSGHDRGLAITAGSSTTDPATVESTIGLHPAMIRGGQNLKRSDPERNRPESLCAQGRGIGHSQKVGHDCCHKATAGVAFCASGSRVADTC